MFFLQKHMSSRFVLVSRKQREAAGEKAQHSNSRGDLQQKIGLAGAFYSGAENRAVGKQRD